jgi:hypothetical protein
MVGCKPPCFVKIPISLTRLKNLTVEARSHIDQGIVDDQIANNLLRLAEPKLWRKSLPSWWTNTSNGWVFGISSELLVNGISSELLVNGISSELLVSLVVGYYIMFYRTSEWG